MDRAYHQRPPDAIFWLTCTCAIIALLCNKILDSSNIRVKYIYAKELIKSYKSEGWQFITCINKYSTLVPYERFKLLCTRLERLDKKTIIAITKLETQKNISQMPHPFSYSASSAVSVVSDEQPQIIESTIAP